ncbi:short chain dehydrogenase [Amycolatopsis sp. H20-H5]|uniref:short chain dehydrogenase n=1 Tax=Amycolatopsis sp. H20-H5 TaxID=3046309 RepID=UPI002DB90556|nr:short chain dehydrogenase [Amycolatopsis sp. H20-H5]MEC3975245.1 short chain dehydrogenase [Amycolatopsis sp. H20-H5]
MRIIVIGATGTIGSAVAGVLAADHEVIRASRRGEARVDLTDPASLDALFASAGDVDAVVCCAANAPMSPLLSGSDEEFTRGLEGKLLGQVRLVRRAANHLRDGGSITLTGGAFARPTPGGAFGTLVNAGIEAFARAAAVELPRGLRINVVSPGWVTETALELGLDPSGTTPVAEVAAVYRDFVEGRPVSSATAATAR